MIFLRATTPGLHQVCLPGQTPILSGPSSFSLWFGQELSPSTFFSNTTHYESRHANIAISLSLYVPSDNATIEAAYLAIDK